MTSHQDHGAAPAFYATPLGGVAAKLIGRRLGEIWPDRPGLSVLGVGYPAPFLHLWPSSARVLNATTSHHEPPPGSCAAHAMHLPFPDLAFDRVLVIHGVEPVGQDARLLREIWRVLKDDGRMLVVAPNRTGLWAHIDSTPFGQGRPYSRGQLDRLLAGTLFRAERHETALFAPPASSGLLLRTAALWESVGHAMFAELAGVTIVEAVKDAYAALPVASVARRRVVLSEAA